MSIDDYLDEVYRRLPRDPRVARRTLDETADHLNAAADALHASGLDRDEAEAEAVRRFGPVATLVRPATRHAVRALVLGGAWTATLLAGLGLVAVGVSGAVAAVMNALFGPTFVGGPALSGTDVRTSDLYSLSALGPAQEVSADAVSLRLLAGAVGVAVLLAVWTVRRRPPWRLLPDGLTSVLAAAAFGGATLVLAAASVAQWAQYGVDGVGYSLSAVLVAAPATIVAGVPAVRSMITR